jgi:hypothetical protein
MLNNIFSCTRLCIVPVYAAFIFPLWKNLRSDNVACRSAHLTASKRGILFSSYSPTLFFLVLSVCRLHSGISRHRSSEANFCVKVGLAGGRVDSYPEWALTIKLTTISNIKSLHRRQCKPFLCLIVFQYCIKWCVIHSLECDTFRLSKIHNPKTRQERNLPIFENLTFEQITLLHFNVWG